MIEKLEKKIDRIKVEKQKVEYIKVPGKDIVLEKEVFVEKPLYI